MSIACDSRSELSVRVKIEMVGKSGDGSAVGFHHARDGVLSFLNPIQVVLRSNEKGPVADRVGCQGAFA
jgi:hypothetical protein